MKKTRLLLLVFLFMVSYIMKGQDIIPKNNNNKKETIEAIEKTIAYYIQSNLDIELPQEILNKLKQMPESETSSQKEFEISFLSAKKAYLRSLFFKNNPGLNNAYRAARSVNPCIDGDFESGHDNFSAKTTVFGGEPMLTEIKSVADGNNLSEVTLVGPGFDPIINEITLNGANGNPESSLSMTNYSGTAIRINQNRQHHSNVHDNAEKDILIKTFTAEDRIITLDYAAVFEKGSNHGTNHSEHPYFRVTAYKVNRRGKTYITSKTIYASSTNANLISLNYESTTTLVYNKWKKMTLDIGANNANQKIELTMEVRDCDNKIHGGYVYVDNISNCADGDDPIINPPPPPSCPDASCIYIYGNVASSCGDTAVAMSASCANGINRIDWKYSIGPYSNVSFGTSVVPYITNLVPIYLPHDNWNNQYLTVTAKITLTDGTICVRKKRHLMRCNGANGNTRIMMHPNPSKSNNQISFDGVDSKDVKSIELLDLFGNSKIKIKPNKNSFNIPQLQSGLYIVKFYTTKGIEQKKLIIE